LNGDCRVTGSDQGILQNQNNQKSYPDPGYNSLYDLNSDGAVNSLDLNLLTPVLNKDCPKFTYDQDGQLVKLSGPKNVVYIDGIYEKNLDTTVVTKYYSADGRRVAMRAGNVLSYLANDHLGSTAFVLDSTQSGALLTQMRYYSYGMTWTQSGPNPPTDLLFTGHRRIGMKSGTYYAGARNYSADLGRFTQPEAFPMQHRATAPCAIGLTERRSGILTNGQRVQKGDPRLLNSYSYAINNPVNYVDPTGRDFEFAPVIDWSVLVILSPNPRTGPHVFLIVAQRRNQP
jgi:RHS repeat-associated protein